jgi:hypothetical protein
MFKEATKSRAVVHKKQLELPLTFDEVVNASKLSLLIHSVKGRFRWDSKSKSWDVIFKLYRDQWIQLLKTIS